MKVLVTGGAGFIGSHITDELVRRGYSVRIMDNLEPQVHGGKVPDYINKSAEFFKGDTTSPGDWARALKGVDAVIHEAAATGIGQSMYNPARFHMSNTVGTSLMYESIINHKFPIKKIVVASSKCIYGEGAYRCGEHGEVWPGQRPLEQMKKHDWELHCPKCDEHVGPIAIREDKPPQNISSYALSKYDQERLAVNFGHALNIPTIALRYFNVYGPRQSMNNPYTGITAIFSSRIKNGNPPVIYEDGLQTKDFIFVSDVVQANMLALEKGEGVKVYNVGWGIPITVLDIVNTLVKLYDSGVKPDVAGEFRMGDNRHDFADIGLIRKEIGFHPTVKFADGMRKLVEWGRTQEAEDKFDQANSEFKAKLSR
jgi:dTDP-L-rhamnose 4-epimerase